MYPVDLYDRKLCKFKYITEKCDTDTFKYNKLVSMIWVVEWVTYQVLTHLVVGVVIRGITVNNNIKYFLNNPSSWFPVQRKTILHYKE